MERLRAPPLLWVTSSECSPTPTHTHVHGHTYINLRRSNLPERNLSFDPVGVTATRINYLFLFRSVATKHSPLLLYSNDHPPIPSIPKYLPFLFKGERVVFCENRLPGPTRVYYANDGNLARKTSIRRHRYARWRVRRKTTCKEKEIIFVSFRFFFLFNRPHTFYYIQYYLSLTSFIFIFDSYTLHPSVLLHFFKNSFNLWRILTQKKLSYPICTPNCPDFFF